MGFGKNFKMVMDYRGLTPTEIAAALNMSRGTLYSIIRNDAMPAANLALALCEFLCVDYILMCEKDLEPRDLELDPGLFVPPRSERSARILNERYKRRGLPADFSARDLAVAAELSPEEAHLVLAFRDLNTEGQEKLRGYAVDLVASGRYAKEDD